MVLHLLGKKSWSVYNRANIERVHHDEALARAREEAEDLRMQEADAARRTAILRGEQLSRLASPEPAIAVDLAGGRSRDADGGAVRKRRRVRGEDETDREIRFAREDAEAGRTCKQTWGGGTRNGERDAPLQDHAGHIQLLPAPARRVGEKAEKNVEAEREKARQRRRDEDRYTMRFSNATGVTDGSTRPWYTSDRPSEPSESAKGALVLVGVQSKDVWGHEDPRRPEREQKRIASNDPFAVMQSAQRQLKQSGCDRERWQKQRAAELEDLKRAEEKSLRREKRHRKRGADRDSLEDFSLDEPVYQMMERTDNAGSGDLSHRRHRHHSRKRSEERRRHHHHHHQHHHEKPSNRA